MTDVWAAIASENRDGRMVHYLVAVGTKEQCEERRARHGLTATGAQVNRGRVDIVPHERWLELKREMNGQAPSGAP